MIVHYAIRCSPSSDNSFAVVKQIQSTSSRRLSFIPFPGTPMRRHSFMLVAVALLVNVNAAAQSHINADNIDVLNTPQILSRNYKSNVNHNDDEEEERMISIPIVEKLTNSLKSIDDLDDWLNKGTSVDDAFKLLALDKVGDNVLINPNLKAWMRYIKLFNLKNPTKKTSVIATLTAYYGDKALATIIEAAKHISSSTTIAKRLQAEQLRYWVVQKRSLDDVLGFLKLDEVGDQLFTQPQFFTWVQYVDDFNQANLDKQTTLFSALKTHYDEATLVAMTIAAKKAPSTEGIAIRVQSEQTNLWIHDNRSPSEIFTLLKLNEGKPFTNPVFNAWLRYTDEFNMQKIEDVKNKITSMSTLRKSYKDIELAKMILAASKSPDTANLSERMRSELVREWFRNVKPPEFYFKALKLEKTGLRLLERSLFSVWKDYMDFVKMMDPTIKGNLLTPLTKVYSEEKLSNILVSAANTSSTKDIATELLDLQINRWLSEKKDPKKVFSLLGVEKAAADDASKLTYDKYIEAFKNLP